MTLMTFSSGASEGGAWPAGVAGVAGSSAALASSSSGSKVSSSSESTFSSAAASMCWTSWLISARGWIGSRHCVSGRWVRPPGRPCSSVPKASPVAASHIRTRWSTPSVSSTEVCRRQTMILSALPLCASGTTQRFTDWNMYSGELQGIGIFSKILPEITSAASPDSFRRSISARSRLAFCTIALMSTQASMPLSKPTNMHSSSGQDRPMDVTDSAPAASSMLSVTLLKKL
mmetsp:Transcript_97454/g.297805  ORF Transcript_97454/g.297805 Transcript_97454/m.297805 type:complete len:231 (-) Transcript_97454:2096-2788(-)